MFGSFISIYIYLYVKIHYQKGIQNHVIHRNKYQSEIEPSSVEHVCPTPKEDTLKGCDTNLK